MPTNQQSLAGMILKPPDRFVADALGPLVAARWGWEHARAVCSGSGSTVVQCMKLGWLCGWCWLVPEEGWQVASGETGGSLCNSRPLASWLLQGGAGCIFQSLQRWVRRGGRLHQVKVVRGRAPGVFAARWGWEHRCACTKLGKQGWQMLQEVTARLLKRIDQTQARKPLLPAMRSPT